MRLVAKRSEDEAGEHLPAVAQQEPASKERRSHERVVAEADIPEHGRKCEEGDKRGGARIAESAAADQEVERQGQCLEEDEGGQVRKLREPSADKEEDGGV